jgi:GT2 family glycosyltransferase
MIAFGVCVGSAERFRRVALRGLELAAEPDSLVMETSTEDSICEAYNEVLETLAGRHDLEALVLLHDDAEIVDPHFCAKLRRGLADGEPAVVGVIGARGVTSLRWWKNDGVGRVRETLRLIDFGGSGQVDAVDGLLLALSPWAVRNLRFDTQRFRGFHGYDVDYCFQARAAGRRVVVENLEVIHHPQGGYKDEAAFAEADEAFRRKWLAGRATASAPMGSPSAGSHPGL